MHPKKLFRKKSTDGLQSRPTTPKSSDVYNIPHVDLFIDEKLPFEYFQQDVLNLIHALRIPGYSHVTLDMLSDVQIEQISSALTNSVFSVKPPVLPKKVKAPALLLRVYGTQTDLLINREEELETLSKLTQHNIGPKLLGTFKNGRIEQFLHAKTLTPYDLRQPETSTQIAKRLHDLHANIPVDANSNFKVFANYARWLPIFKHRLTLLEQSCAGTTLRVLGTTLPKFESAVDQYFNFLKTKYQNSIPIFCHNDTQYGNIMKLDPPRGSPLLQPHLEHKQLVVIDFEYSGPNFVAFDIANHFCEWMSDFHNAEQPHHIWQDKYPTLDEQMNFIRSYVEYGSVDLDEAKMDKEISELLEGINDFKPAVNVLWGMWGVIQTPVDDSVRMRELEKNPKYLLVGSPSSVIEEVVEEKFDNLEYAREKIALFWSEQTSE